MKPIAWVVVLALTAWCGRPRSNHDLTIVDGYVLTMTGAPVKGAQVRV